MQGTTSAGTVLGIRRQDTHLDVIGVDRYGAVGVGTNIQGVATLG
jgi:hypothetical protein